MQWGGDVARIEWLAGGVANAVWGVRVKGQLAVARRGARSDADLASETKLLPAFSSSTGLILQPNYRISH